MGVDYIEAAQHLWGSCERRPWNQKCLSLGVSSCPITQAAPLIVTWREPTPPIKELTIGGVFFAANAWRSGYPSLHTEETTGSLEGFWRKAFFSFVAWDSSSISGMTLHRFGTHIPSGH